MTTLETIQQEAREQLDRVWPIKSLDEYLKDYEFSQQFSSMQIAGVALPVTATELVLVEQTYNALVMKKRDVEYALYRAIESAWLASREELEK